MDLASMNPVSMLLSQPSSPGSSRSKVSGVEPIPHLGKNVSLGVLGAANLIRGVVTSLLY